MCPFSRNSDPVFWVNRSLRLLRELVAADASRELTQDLLSVFPSLSSLILPRTLWRRRGSSLNFPGGVAPAEAVFREMRG
jgi:hypothetical protein